MRKPRIPVSGSLTWMPVADEPLHHLLFSDARMRVYEAIIAPGEQTAFHRHDRHTLYAVIAGGKSSTEAFTGAIVGAYRFPRTTRLSRLLTWAFTQAVFGWTDMPDGEWFIMPACGRPITHRVRASAANRAALRMLGVELVPHALAERQRPARPSHHRRPDYEDEWVRVWELPCSRISRAAHSGVIVMTAGVGAGEYHHFDAGAALTVAEPDGVYRAIAIEMK